MDVVERLSLDQAAADDLLALTHVQRYALATELCAGLRVADVCCGSGYGSRMLADSAASVTGIDRDTGSVEAASEAFGNVGGLDFASADAHEFLAGELSDRFDAIVILEGLEHLDDLDRALDSLAHHARAGMRIIASLPNSKPFGEQNPHHVTEFDQPSAIVALDRLGDATYLYQYNAEGSLIAAPGEPDADLDGRLVLSGRAEPEWCSHVIGLVNFDLDPEPAARMRLDVAPAHARHMAALEHANRELWLANTRLWRERLAVADSAAASELARRKQAEEMPERVAAGVGTLLIARPIRFAWRVGGALLALMPAPLARWVRRRLGLGPGPI
jgi:SAM-dependent methyltransferase